MTGTILPYKMSTLFRNHLCYRSAANATLQVDDNQIQTKFPDGEETIIARGSIQNNYKPWVDVTITIFCDF
jgi:hypothetical protein